MAGAWHESQKRGDKLRQPLRKQCEWLAWRVQSLDEGTSWEVDPEYRDLSSVWRQGDFLMRRRSKWSEISSCQQALPEVDQPFRQKICDLSARIPSAHAVYSTRTRHMRSLLGFASCVVLTVDDHIHVQIAMLRPLAWALV